MKLFRILLLATCMMLALSAGANITNTTARVGPYTCTVLPATLSVTFPFQQGSDLVVLNLGQSGTSIDPPTVLTLNSDYTVTGGGYNPTFNMQSGNVVVVSTGAHAVAVNDRIVIIRGVPINQGTSFTTGVLTAAAIERAFDKQATISQMLQEVSGRSLRFQPGEVIDGTLNRTARSGKVLGFDTSGNIAYYAFVSGAVVPQSIQGTANQVLVNGSSGTPITGAATLTTPQSIGTSSTVQFSKMGIGAAAIGNSDVSIVHSLPGVTAQASVVVYGALNAPAATDLHPNAFRDSTIYTPTFAADAYASYDAQSQMAGAVNLNHYRGFQARHIYTGSGTLGEMSGYMTANMGLNGLGTVTFMRSFYVSDPHVSGGGSVGQFDGLYVDQLTKGTTRHAIYIAGNDPVFMAGGQLAISDLLTPTNVNTRIDVTFDQATQYGIGVKNKNAAATGYFMQFYNSGGAVQGSIQQSSAVLTAFNTASDARLKKNIRSFRESGSLIDAMQPRVFDWINGPKDSHGFVAQELAGVYPEAVSAGGADPKTQPWQVDYSKLTPVLVAEAKDLRGRVAALEARADESDRAFLLLFALTFVLSLSVIYLIRRK